MSLVNSLPSLGFSVGTSFYLSTRFLRQGRWEIDENIGLGSRVVTDNWETMQLFLFFLHFAIATLKKENKYKHSIFGLEFEILLSTLS